MATPLSVNANASGANSGFQVASPIRETAPHTTPALHHTLQHDTSILALAVSKDSIFVGTQNGEIIVWSLATFRQTHCIQAHNRSVMCLCLTDCGRMLISSAASDPIVNIWCPDSMERLFEIYSTSDSFGDIFSVAYSPKHETVYYGAQNTSIQWVSLADPDCRVSHESANHPDRRNHRFFDSRAPGGSSTPRHNSGRHDLIPRSRTVLETDRRATRMYAHFGFVYCMLVASSDDDDMLISGGGDGTIKGWRLGGREVGPDGIETGLDEVMTLGEDDAQSVLSLSIDGSFLYAGKLDGIVELWDLDTKQKLRSIKAHRGDVWALQMGWGYLWSAGSNGTASVSTALPFAVPGALLTRTAETQHRPLRRTPNRAVTHRQPEVSMPNAMARPQGKGSCLGADQLQWRFSVHYWRQRRYG